MTRLRRLQAVLDSVNRDITATVSDGGKFAGAMVSEGYRGGYRDAIQDVMMYLHGTEPQDRRGYWEKP